MKTKQNKNTCKQKNNNLFCGNNINQNTCECTKLPFLDSWEGHNGQLV